MLLAVQAAADGDVSHAALALRAALAAVAATSLSSPTTSAAIVASEAHCRRVGAKRRSEHVQMYI